MRTRVVRFVEAVRGEHGLARSLAEQARRSCSADRSRVTLAYIGALAAAVAAFHGGASLRRGRGRVSRRVAHRGRRADARAASARWRPRSSPGFTGVGMESGVAVAAVLSYRLVTYWLPILPGWISFHVLERREPDLGQADLAALHRQTLATEAERPTLQRAEQQPEAGAADDVERQVGACVDPRERNHDGDEPDATGLPRVGGATARARPRARTRRHVCPET